MKTLYTAHVTTTAGRDGRSQSDDKVIDLKQSRPGASDGGTNPEQLFAAGYSACFGSALANVAKSKKIDLREVKVTADVSLHQDDDNGFYLSAVLNVELAGVDDATAQELTDMAHTVCPYSKATRGNIDVTLTAKGNGKQAAA